MAAVVGGYRRRSRLQKRAILRSKTRKVLVLLRDVYEALMRPLRCKNCPECQSASDTAILPDATPGQLMSAGMKITLSGVSFVHSFVTNTFPGADADAFVDLA